MGSIRDDRGYNQGFKPSKALSVRTKRRCEYMIRRMNFSENTKILEIGCGTGEISYLVAKKTGCYTLGTDLCVDFVKQAEKKYLRDNLEYKTLDFSSIENIEKVVGKTRFDYIIGNGILHHLYYRIDNTLKNINSILKEDGKIIFLEPNILNPYCFLIFKFSFFRKIANLEPEEMAFTKKFIKRKLVQNGFKNVVVEYKDFLIPGTPKMLIKPIIFAGKFAEKLPLVKNISQSIYITAAKRKK